MVGWNLCASRSPSVLPRNRGFHGENIETPALHGSIAAGCWGGGALRDNGLALARPRSLPREILRTAVLPQASRPPRLFFYFSFYFILKKVPNKGLRRSRNA